MKRFLAVLAMVLGACVLYAQEKTLRLDYVFTGTDKEQQIALDEMSCFDGWAGRTVNMDKVPVRGNGQIYLTDIARARLFTVRHSRLFSRSGRRQRRQSGCANPSRMCFSFLCRRLRLR